MIEKQLEPLSAAALIALIISVVLIIGPAVTCTSILPDSAHICPPLGSVSVLLGVLLLYAGLILAVVTWVFGLIVTAQKRRWDWFVLILILNVFGVLVYAFATKRALAN
jgi:hypothetical protein